MRGHGSKDRCQGRSKGGASTPHGNPSPCGSKNKIITVRTGDSGGTYAARIYCRFQYTPLISKLGLACPDQRDVLHSYYVCVYSSVFNIGYLNVCKPKGRKDEQRLGRATCLSLGNVVGGTLPDGRQP